MSMAHRGTPMNSPYMTLILTGGLLGTMMWFNVWFIIWPAQQVVIASAEKVASGGEALPTAAARGARSGMVSRTNVLFSIPMLFFMGAASHLQSLAQTEKTGVYWAAVIVVVALIEANALQKPGAASQKPLTSVSGVIGAGFALSIVLFLVARLLLAAPA
jgi:uncharacterized membrane protein